MQPESLYQANKEFIEAIAVFSFEEREEIMRAFVAASNWHGEQKRKTGMPYILHPLEVAAATVRFGGDAAAVCAALLHDVIEDTEISDDAVKDIFGKEIHGLVHAVTRRPGMDHGDFLENVLNAALKDPRVAIMKLADSWVNNRGTAKLIFSKKKHLEHLLELEDFYVPKLSHTPGVSAVATNTIAQTAKDVRALYESR